MAAPLLVGMLCVEKRYRAYFVFVLAGMTACLLSAYVNSFFAGLYQADVATATAEITPLVEEVMKLLPLLFYLLVYEPESRRAQIAVIIIAVSFATFENVCWLVENGAAQLDYLLLRGFSAGAMHVACVAVVAYGLVWIWRTPWLRVTGTLGLLCTAVTFHAMYNLLISADGAARVTGYVMPIAAVLIGYAAVLLVRAHRARPAAEAPPDES